MRMISVSGEELRMKLRGSYEALITKINELYDIDKKLTVFSPIVGSNYENSASRLVICGRAVDGWRNSWNPQRPVLETVEKIFHIPSADKIAECEMNWIRRNRRAWVEGNKESYNYKRSSFWCGARDVLKVLEGSPKLKEHEWPSRLVWSNVYKISPAVRGNPDNLLRSIQMPFCSEILKAEINYLKPRNILFLTGGWGRKILADLQITPDINKDPIQYTGFREFDYGIARVVVTVRPEGRKRAQWVNAVVSAFKGT